jgi:hypothetical protein
MDSKRDRYRRKYEAETRKKRNLILTAVKTVSKKAE